MLIAALPRGSATRNAAIGEADDWGVREHLAADQIDATFMLAWITAGNKKNPKPDPVPRPGSAHPNVNRRTALSGREIERRLLERRRRREERA